VFRLAERFVSPLEIVDLDPPREIVNESEPSSNEKLSPEKSALSETPAVAAEPVSLLTEPSSWQDKFHRMRTWGMVVVLLVFLGVGIHFVRMYFLSSAGRAGDPKEIQNQKVMLAVLPFENLSGDSDQEYFSDGLTQELITRLGSLAPDDLGVIARTTMKQYKNTEMPISQIGAELGVDCILEGSVRREGDRLRISVELNRTGDQSQLWSKTYVCKSQDVLLAQIEVTRQIARSLSLEVLPESPEAKKQVVDPRALDAYLKGRHFRDMLSEEGYRKGILLFNQAIEYDPDFAPAYASRASCFCLLSGHGLEVDLPSNLMTNAGALAQRAIELDDSLSEAHGVLGMVKLKYEWDWVSAEREFMRAIRLNPNDPMARIWYAFYLSSRGRHDEAIAEVKIARGLDPLSRIANLNVAWQYYMARRYDEFNDTLELFPRMWVAHWGRGLSYCQKGMRNPAITDLEFAVEISGENNAALGALGFANAVFGERKAADETLALLIARSQEAYVPPVSISAIYAAKGDLENAFQWLEKAYEVRSRSLIWLAVGHEFDPMRKDLRYQDILHRMGSKDRQN
jgi:TolB-like protein/Flp pilus assembly protein TadD